MAYKETLPHIVKLCSGALHVYHGQVGMCERQKGGDKVPPALDPLKTLLSECLADTIALKEKSLRHINEDMHRTLELSSSVLSDFIEDPLYGEEDKKKLRDEARWNDMAVSRHAKSLIPVVERSFDEIIIDLRSLLKRCDILEKSFES